MRLVAGVLSLALFAPFAHAEDPATPAPTPTPVPPPASPASPGEAARVRVPFFVVRVMPETRQALLFDRSRNTHVLAEVGGKLDGYTIEDIDDETVSLRRDNQQIVLAAPPRGAGRARELSPVRVRSATAAPADPGAPSPGGPPGPLDPYGDSPSPAGGIAAPAPARLAPPAPGEGLPPEPGIRVAHAPDASTPLATAPALVPGEGGVRVAVAPDVGPGVDPGARPSAAPSLAGPVASLPPGAAGPGAIRVVSAAQGAAPPPPSTPPGAPSAAPVASSAPGVVPGGPSAAPVASPAPGVVPGVPSAAPADPYSAPAAPSAAPAAPSAPLAAPSAPLAAPSAPLAPTAAVASGPAPAAPGAPAAVSSAAGPAVPDRSSRETANPVTTPPRAPVGTTAAALAPAEARPAEIREVRATDAARAPDKRTADARALADIMTADHPTRSPRAPVELPPPTHGAEVRPAVAPAATPGDAIAISRSDLDSALADFARLTAGVRGSFSATGVVIDSVGAGTIFQRAGLRTGDVVTSVDGVRLRTLDDAANLYARASTARAITAQVVRAGKPVTLHVVIQ